MIKIRPTEESAKINVTSTIDSGSVSAYDSAGIFFADLAKKWAISDSLVQNTDYSSKYYAEQSKTSSALAEAKLGEIEDFVLDAKSDIQQDKNNVLAEIDSACENAVESIVFAGDTKVSQVNTTANSKISEMNDIVDDVNAIKTQTQQYMLNASSSADDAASDAQTAVGAKNAVLNAISGYGDIVTHNVSEFATSIQGQKADSALQSISSANVTNALGYTPVNPSDLAVVATSGNYNDLTNKPSIPEGVIVDQTYNASSTNAQSGTAVAGAISGKQNTLVSGTNIKTVNNTSLLGSGNVAVQPTLVSGTNIKTINNTSLLGSGNIDTSEVFIAEYGVTSFADIETAYNAGKVVFCNAHNGNYLPITRVTSTRIDFDQQVGKTRWTYLVTKNVGWDFQNYDILTGYEQTSNKVTSLSSSSTDTQYPSAKCVYDQLATKASISVSGTTLVIS